MSAKWNPDYSGTVLGITIAIGALGCVAAPPLMAWLLRALPSAAVFPVSGLPLLVAAGLLVAYRRPAGRRVPGSAAAMTSSGRLRAHARG
jgi:hypothetical protein